MADSLASAWRVQQRIVVALLMREILTRFGRHNIGFLWLFVEPMLFTLGVTALWTATKSVHGSNLPIVAFALTGYSSVLLWRNMPSRCILAVTHIRVTRPGGMLYLRFDPVWTADSGSHFLHLIGAPWAHLLLSDDEIAEVMLSNGATTDEVASYRNDMNRLPVSYYREAFPRIIAELGCKTEFSVDWSGTVDPDSIQNQNRFEAASKLGINDADLLVRGFQFVVRKG